jgi:hypothetical protein
MSRGLLFAAAATLTVLSSLTAASATPASIGASLQPTGAAITRVQYYPGYDYGSPLDLPAAVIGGTLGFVAGTLSTGYDGQPYPYYGTIKDGVLVLYDVTSSYLEGRRCELAQFGYSRDHRRDRAQIVFGLLCTREGCPIAVEVFEGNLGDPSTLAHQVRALRVRFRLKRIVLVGDRGMITQARIDVDLGPAGFDWITALRAPAMQALAAGGGPLQLSLFDERDLAEIASDDYPGERLIVCRNPELAAERTRKRAELLEATEKALVKIRAMTERKRNPLRGKDKIALKVGAVLDRRRMASSGLRQTMRRSPG